MTTRILQQPLTVSQRIAAGLGAMFFGTFLVFGAGLSHSDTLHNAAHDTRHAIGFPCH